MQNGLSVCIGKCVHACVCVHLCGVFILLFVCTCVHAFVLVLWRALIYFLSTCNRFPPEALGSDAVSVMTMCLDVARQKRKSLLLALALSAVAWYQA